MEEKEYIEVIQSLGNEIKTYSLDMCKEMLRSLDYDIQEMKKYSDLKLKMKAKMHNMSVEDFLNNIFAKQVKDFEYYKLVCLDRIKELESNDK